MDCSDRHLEQISDIEQMAVIGRIHNMQWLKSNSQFSGHSKNRSHERERKTVGVETAETEIERRTSFNENQQSDGANEQDALSGSSLNSESEESIDRLIRSIGNTSASTPVNAVSQDMETAWKKDSNAANALFPDAQSLVLQRLEEEEEMSIALAESIITAQLEQFRMDEQKKDEPDARHSESDDDTWGKVRRNLPEPVESTAESKADEAKRHDNNNNTRQSKSDVKASEQSDGEKSKDEGPKDSQTKQSDKSKGSVGSKTVKTANCAKDLRKGVPGLSAPVKIIDRYGRVDSCSDRHSFAERGARMKEQEFLKQHSSTFTASVKSKAQTEDKAKQTATKPCQLRNDSSKAEDVKRYRNQGLYNQSSAQYNRNRSIQSNQRSSKTVTKPEQESFLKPFVSASNDDKNKSSSEESQSKVKDISKSSSLSAESYKKEQFNKTEDNKKSLQGSLHTDKQYHDNDAKVLQKQESNSETECNSHEKTVQCANVDKTGLAASGSQTDLKNYRDDQRYSMISRKDSNFCRRSVEYIRSDRVKPKPKPDYAQNSNNGTVREHKIARLCTLNAKQNEPDNKRIYEKPSSNCKKPVNTNAPGASGNILPGKFNNSSEKLQNIDNVTASKDSINNNSSNYTQKSGAPETSDTFKEETKSIAKVEPEPRDNFENRELAKANNNPDTKSVTFAENIQEIKISNYQPEQYRNDSHSTNPFLSDSQNVHNVNTMQSEQNKYLFNTAVQYNNVPATSVPYNNVPPSNVQYFNQNLHSQPVQHTIDQSHNSPQSLAPQNMCNPSMMMNNGVMQYSNIPMMYLNQYNAQNMPAKIDNTSHNIPSRPLNGETESHVQNHLMNVPLHNQQNMMPPSFHNHLPAVPQNQWNMQMQDPLYHGNLMNPAQCLNMQIPNPKPVCGNVYNNVQPTNYMPQPIFCVPSVYMQNWDPNLRYPVSYFPGSQCNSHNAFCEQPMQAGNMNEQFNYQYAQENMYKYHHPQQTEHNSVSPSTYTRHENYGSSQNYTSSYNADVKSDQNRRSQNDVQQDETERSNPPMISPKDCIYGMSFPKNRYQNRAAKFEYKSYGYSRSSSSQNRNSEFHKNETYQDEFYKTGRGRGFNCKS